MQLLVAGVEVVVGAESDSHRRRERSQRQSREREERQSREREERHSRKREVREIRRESESKKEKPFCLPPFILFYRPI